MSGQAPERADYLTAVHMALVALVLEDRRRDAADLLDTLDPEEQREMFIRGLWDTALLASGLAGHIGVDDVPGWLRSFGQGEL